MLYPMAEIAVPTQSIALSGAAQALTFTTPASLDQAGLDLGTSARITIPAEIAYSPYGPVVSGVSGVWIVNVMLEWSANATGYRQITLEHRSSGGGLLATWNQANILNTANPCALSLCVPLYAVTGGDYVVIQGLQTSGGALDVVGNVQLVRVDGSPLLYVGTAPNQTSTNGSNAIVNWDTPTIDQGGIYTPNDSSGKINYTNLWAGFQGALRRFFMAATVTHEANATGERDCWIQQGDSRIFGGNIGAVAMPITPSSYIQSSALPSALTGNPIDVSRFQQSGGTRTTSAIKTVMVQLPSTGRRGGVNPGSTVALQNDTETPINWGSGGVAGGVVNDLGGFYSAAQPTRFTMPVAGRYLWTGRVSLSQNSATGYREFRAQHRSSAGALLRESVWRVRALTAGNGAAASPVLFIPDAAAGDYVEFRVRQNSGLNTVIWQVSTLQILQLAGDP